MTWELQMCGDEWYSVSGPQASEVRLWDAAWWDEDDPAQGTYVVGDEPVAVVFHDGAGYACQDGSDGWRTWAGALSHAVQFNPDAIAIKRWIEAQS